MISYVGSALIINKKMDELEAKIDELESRIENLEKSIEEYEEMNNNQKTKTLTYTIIT